MSFVEIRSVGTEIRRLACDGGYFAPPDCLIFIPAPPPGTGIPEDWVTVEDPFGRVSRETGERLSLHLCPSCTRHIPDGAPPPIVADPEASLR